MSASYIQVPDNAGAEKIRTEQVTVGANDVDMQVGVIADAAGTEVTTTTVGSDVGLDANIINASIAVTAASLPLPSGAATQATLAAVQTAVETLDNAISGSEMQVDVVAALPAGDNNIGNVDLASAIPAGTNNIGDVDIASIAAGDNNIGNVDIVTMPNVTLAASTNNIGDVDILSIAAGDNNIGNVDVASIAAGDTTIGRVKITDGTDLALVSAGGALLVDGSATTQPVSGTVTVQDGGGVISVDDGGSTLSVDDGGGSITVDGTFWQATQPVSIAATVTVDTELAAAAVVGDGTVSYTAPAVAAVVVAYNGAEYDRIRGTAANGLEVEVTQMPAVEISTIAAGDNNIGNVDVVTLPAIPAGTNNIGDVDVASIAAGDNNIGNVDLASAIPAGTNVIGYVGLDPRTSGGLSVSRVISAATTNATVAKASAGQVYGWFLSNVNASPRYLKLYNKASSPSVGSDTPTMTILIPGNATGAGANVEFTNGIAFSTGIAYALTTGVTDANSSAVAADEIVVNLLYK